jgi:very-short-patch-repair endonuclease
MTAAASPSEKHFTYAELKSMGYSRRDLRRLLDGGVLVRVRRGHYVRGDAAADYLRAGRLGGRLDCLSLLHALGAFVLACHHVHVQMTRGASRVPPASKDVIRHWRATAAAPGDLAADLVEALAQACRCQAPRAAIATLDSAWHLGLVDEADIAAVFARLPQRFQVLRQHLDVRSEAGTESLVRLMIRSLGCVVEVQVVVAGVGRVDFVVDGWLIVECDSREFHGKPDDQLRDRRRDLAAAARGYVTLRLLAEDILYRPETVIAALRGVLACRTRS